MTAISLTSLPPEALAEVVRCRGRRRRCRAAQVAWHLRRPPRAACQRRRPACGARARRSRRPLGSPGATACSCNRFRFDVGSAPLERDAAAAGTADRRSTAAAARRAARPVDDRAGGQSQRGQDLALQSAHRPAREDCQLSRHDGRAPPRAAALSTARTPRSSTCPDSTVSKR